MRNCQYFILFVFSWLATMAQEGTADYCFKNARIITMEGDHVVRGDIFISEGFIKEISTDKSNNLIAKHIIDVKGKYILPGLSDAHVHLPKEEQDIERYLLLNLVNGVTHMRSMRGNWDHLELRNKYNTETSTYPKLYISPPPLSRRYDFTDKELEKFVKASKKFDFIKILSIKNEYLFSKLDSLCKKENIVLAGHFPRNISDSLIFRSKFTSFEHLGGLTENKDLFEERIKKIKNNNIFICPTLSWYDIGSGRYSYDELRNMPGMNYVSKEKLDNWIIKTKQYREKIGKEAYENEVLEEISKLEKKYKIIKRLKKEKIPMLLSPDSSAKYMIPGFGLLWEMKLLKEADLSNYEILAMATKNFAEFFEGNYGTIKKGNRADFIILQSNPLEELNNLKKIEGLFLNKRFVTKKEINKIKNFLKRS